MKQKWAKIKAVIREWSILIVMSIPVSILFAYGIVNRDSMSYPGWALLIGIVLSLVLFAFALTKARREGFSGRWVAILILSVGVLFILYLVYNLRQIEPVDWVQIMLMLALVAVTLLSAMSAIRQANASVKMAEEMKEQRYAALKPIIDIQKQIGSGLDSAREEMAALKGELPEALPCKLINIGPGPAIDVYSFIEYPIGKRSRWDFGTIAAGCESPSQAQLFLEPQGDRSFLVAYYKDVYNQRFKSSREVKINKEDRRLDMAPLAICKLPKEEHNNND